MPFRRFRSRRPNKHRPLKAHPPNTGNLRRRSREREPPFARPRGPGNPAAASARGESALRGPLWWRPGRSALAKGKLRFAVFRRPGTEPQRSRLGRVPLRGLPTPGPRPQQCHQGRVALRGSPRRGPGTGGGPQPDPIPARRSRSRRPNKHRPLKPHPPTPGTQDAGPPSVSLASRPTRAREPKTRPGERESRFARPRGPGTRPRFRTRPGTRHRRRAAARSHTPQAVSFAPPKQAQALKTSPTNTGNPRRRSREREPRFAHPRRPGNPPAAVSPRPSPASLTHPRRGPGTGGGPSPIPCLSGGFVRAAQTSTGP
ncbi:hypothetical protein HNR73_003698 [Phytomonospora endophytica]|uniref:Uncharacterized protein n=1 Tax=Phytomonospora endophytica TaxID=714109 RepID=A0A841FIY3_9ACTN|nr:hypothetical protein [Phytomonospora endophytica]